MINNKAASLPFMFNSYTFSYPTLAFAAGLYLTICKEKVINNKDVKIFCQVLVVSLPFLFYNYTFSYPTLALLLVYILESVKI